MGSNSSSFQLIPVSMLPSSNLNCSVGTTSVVNQPGKTIVSGQDNKMHQGKEASKQEDASGEVTPANVQNPWSKVKMDAGLKKLRYLLKELKECGKIGKDVEVTRLAKEVEKTLETIPTLSSTFNLMAEIDLCLQPLRNENCQLRRKLRLTNQHLKEKEAVKEKAALDFDVIHLQASNNALQKQMKGEKETKVKLAMELKDLHSQIQRMKIERSKLLAALSEKETDELKVKQECLSDSQKFRHEIEELQRQTEAIQLKHESVEQENHILQITLQQRDTEIYKMQQVVSEVKDCVALLIQELEESRAGEKSFVSNNSFSLQKLMRVLGEDSVASFTVGKKPATEREPRQNLYSMPPERSRLTVQALATHNKKQPSGKGVNRGPQDRDNLEDFKTSNSDTEVELNLEDHEYKRKQSTAIATRRGRSLSPPSRRVPLRERNVPNVNATSSKQRRRTPPSQSPGRSNKAPNNRIGLNRSLSPKIQRNPRVAFDFSKTRYRKDSDDLQSENEGMSNIQHSCNQSEASRYSVTDYFRKYPVSKPSIGNSGVTRHHTRSYSQPNYRERYEDDQWSPSMSQPIKTKAFLSPERQDFKNRKESSSYSPQDNLYHGTCLDNSISAINDDNISSVSAQTVSTATTINDTSFRRGIAALDANILKLQLALQKTKNMLS